MLRWYKLLFTDGKSGAKKKTKMLRIGGVFRPSTMIVLLLTSIILAACASGEPDKVTDNPTSSPQETQSAFPLTVLDATGEKVVIDKEPTRIVSLMPSNTEILFALGAGELVVGVTEWDNYPEEVAGIAKVGDLDFNAELVLAQEPDLVLGHASAMSHSTGFEQLKELGIPVVVVPDAVNFENVYEAIQLIGQAVGYHEQANELIEEMQTELKSFAVKASQIPDDQRKKVWVEVSPQPELFTTGSKTFIDEMLTLLHAENVAKEYEGWVQFTEEDAILLNPDIIIVTYGHYIENPAEQIYQRKAWQNVPAVASRQVYEVHPDIVTRSGPRLIEGVEQLASVIYPDIF